MIQLGNFTFEKAEIQEMRSLEAAEPVESKVAVGGDTRPKCTELLPDGVYVLGRSRCHVAKCVG